MVLFVREFLCGSCWVFLKMVVPALLLFLMSELTIFFLFLQQGSDWKETGRIQNFLLTWYSVSVSFLDESFLRRIRKQSQRNVHIWIDSFVSLFLIDKFKLDLIVNAGCVGLSSRGNSDVENFHYQSSRRAQAGAEPIVSVIVSSLDSINAPRNENVTRLSLARKSLRPLLI